MKQEIWSTWLPRSYLNVRSLWVHRHIKIIKKSKRWFNSLSIFLSSWYFFDPSLWLGEQHEPGGIALMPQITCKNFISWFFFFLTAVTATFSLRSLPTKQSRSRQLLEARRSYCNVPQCVQNKANFFHMAYNTPPDLGLLYFPRLYHSFSLLIWFILAFPQFPRDTSPFPSSGRLFSSSPCIGCFLDRSSLPSLLVCLDDSRLDIPSPGRSLLTLSSELKSMCPVYFSSEHSV